MAKLVTLTVDGREVTVPEGTLIVNAAKMAGVDIPVFCYHPKMEPVGMCRMCLVEVGRPQIDRASGQALREPDGSVKIAFNPKLETACTTPVMDGMVVRGDSEKALLGRKEIVEFLLTSHPLDCPICDKGGECPLQNLTMDWGPGESRYLYDEKIHLAKHVPLGELIYLDRERCIQCGRCVRFQDEIAADPVIGFYQRGRSLEIVTFSEPGFDSYFSGNTTDICPVGALTTADFRFRARPWELNAAASICTQCPVGCNTTLNVRREAASGGEWVVKRVMPRQNEWVNEIWLCDKGRFGYHYAQSKQRLTQPLVRKNGELSPVSWESALDLVAERLGTAGSDLLVLASGRLANEDLFNLQSLASQLGGQSILYSYMAGGDLTAQVGFAPGTNFADLGPESAILVVACDLAEEAPLWWLRVKQAAERGAQLIVANPQTSKLERFASHTLRYAYGDETATVLALVNSLSAKRPDLPGAGNTLARSPELGEAARAFAAAQNGIVIYGSLGVGLQGSQALAQASANLLLATDHVGKVNNGLLGVWSRANDQGAWDMGFRPAPDLNAALGAARCAYIVAADPAGDDSRLAEALHADFVVVQDMFLTSTAKLADVVLPVRSFIEREGTYTSGERRVQRFYPVLPDRSPLLPDFAITGQIGQRLGLDLESRIASRVMGRIAASLPDYAGLSYTALSAVEEQWPIIGRSDLYYGGTTYENRQGLGIQLPPSILQGKPVSLGWPQPPEVSVPKLGLLAFPVTRLYDRGSTLVHSELLHERLAVPQVIMNPEDAQHLKIIDRSTVDLSIAEQHFLVEARLSQEVPAGIALVPRSLGVPVHEPTAVAVRLPEKVAN